MDEEGEEPEKLPFTGGPVGSRKLEELSQGKMVFCWPPGPSPLFVSFSSSLRHVGRKSSRSDYPRGIQPL